MADNWIERRDLRAKVLVECVTSLWHAVGTNIHNTCTYFNEKHSDVGKVQNVPENSHRILVTLTFADPRCKIGYVQFQLDESKPMISVTVDKRPSSHYQIDADIDIDPARCFIKSPRGERLTVDKFTQLALEDFLFKNLEPGARAPKTRGTFT